MQYKYRSKYLVLTDGDVYVYTYGKCIFEPPFIFSSKKCFYW